MHKLCKYIDEQLNSLEQKIDSGKGLSMNEIEFGDKLAHFKKSLLTNKAMEDSFDEDYSNAYNDNMSNGVSYGGNSYRGNSYRGGNVRRDNMGRFSRDSYAMDRYDRENYSRGDEMIEELRDIMHSAPNEQIKSKFKQFIGEIEKM